MLRVLAGELAGAGAQDDRPLQGVAAHRGGPGGADQRRLRLDPHGAGGVDDEPCAQRRQRGVVHDDVALGTRPHRVVAGVQPGHPAGTGPARDPDLEQPTGLGQRVRHGRTDTDHGPVAQRAGGQLLARRHAGVADEQGRRRTRGRRTVAHDPQHRRPGRRTGAAREGAPEGGGEVPDRRVVLGVGRDVVRRAADHRGDQQPHVPPSRPRVRVPVMTRRGSGVRAGRAPPAPRSPARAGCRPACAAARRRRPRRRRGRRHRAGGPGHATAARRPARG